MTLAPGSIAFTGYNSEGSNSLSFVVLEDITAGTVLYFADSNWNGSMFSSNEATWSWMATEDVGAGSVVRLGDLELDTPTASLGSVTVSGGTRGLDNRNESVYAYVGEEGNPSSFLAAISNDDFGNKTGVLTNTGLELGVTALEFKPVDSDADIMAYDGRRVSTSSFDDLLSQINNTDNWITQDGGGDNSSDGVGPDTPFSDDPFVVDPLANGVSFAADSLNVSAVEGDSGTTLISFTVERTGDTSGELTFSGRIIATGTTKADDFAGDLTFTGTIAVGETTGTVTIELAGDTVFENDEDFTLTLESAEGSVVAAFVTDVNAQATGTIVNDDALLADIAFVGFSAEGNDALAFVALGDITAGTEIFFTDNGWRGDRLDANESTWSWTATEDVVAGSVVTMDGLGSGEDYGSNLGAITFITDRRDLDINTESVYAYIGAAGDPTAFLAAIASYDFSSMLANNAFNGRVDGTLDGTGLVLGVNAVSILESADIAAYVGPRSGVASMEEFRALINDPDNWAAQDHNYDQSNDGLTPDLPFSRHGFSAGDDAQVVEFASDSLAVSKAEGDAGMTEVTFTVVRSGGNGAASFWGVLNTAGADAGDFGGSVPISFNGSFVDGETTATITISVAGDTLFEGDESFTLDLVGASNGTAGIVLGDAFRAVGTITNDDVPQVIAFAEESLEISQAEGDEGSVIYSFTIERTGGTTGEANFSGSIGSGTVNAADFGGVLPTSFSGSFADGETSATVSVAVSGDALVEIDETFAVTIDTVSNENVPITIGANAAATGIIVNDEPVPSIAFTGVNAVGDDNLAFVTLTDIAAGTVIWFNDNEWTGSSFNTGESVWSWTATEGVAAGTVITMDTLLAGNSGGQATVNHGAIDLHQGSWVNIATSTEIVYAYIGEPDAPAKFLAGFATYDFSSSGGTLNGTGLVAGVNAVEMRNVGAYSVNIAAYVGLRYGQTDFPAYQAMINDPANWVVQSTSTSDQNDGIAPDAPFSTTGFTTDTNIAFIGFADGSTEVSVAEGDGGNKELTFTVERSGDTSEAVSFSGSIDVSSMVTADDFGGAIPSVFSGIIAAGETTTTVTVTFSGDTLFENNEAVNLTIDTAEAGSVPAYVEADADTATGFIVNDDAVPASIAFVGYNNGTSRNDLSFAAMSDMAAGTTIFFTDNKWDGKVFSNNESTWSWTATEDVAAGTVIDLNGLKDGEATASTGVVTFEEGGSRGFAGTENVYAYVGTAGAPQAFLGAVSSFVFEPSYGVLDGTGLVEGETAVALGERLEDSAHYVYIGAYQGPTSGFPTMEDYFSAINDQTNWAWQRDSLKNDGSDGVFPDVPFDVDEFTIDPAVQLVQFAKGSQDISVIEGDSGTKTLTFTVERSSGDGTVDFSGAITTSGTAQAEDFGASKPISFNGSFADGETTATVTVEVVGDTVHETDESITLMLESASHATASTVIGGRSLAKGIIVDDDAQTLDIIFVGLNAQGDQSLSFLALTDIAEGTTIQFSDKTWYADHFSSDPDNGSIWTWTASGDIVAGSVVSLESLNGETPVSNLGDIVRTGSGQIHYDSAAEIHPAISAYVGDVDQPNSFLTLLSPSFYAEYTDEAGNGVLYAFTGTGLSEADLPKPRSTSAVAYFDGAHSGYVNMTDLKAAIISSDWHSDNQSENGNNGIWPDAPLPTLPYTTDPDVQVVSFAAGDLQAKAEVDDGAVSLYTFTVERTGGTTGEVTFSGHVLTGSYADGDQVTDEDFGGVAPTFTGTIAEGETSTTITIEVSGDTTYEEDETFYVELLSLSNSAGTTVAAGTYVTQAVIVDFDAQPETIADGDVITKTINVEGGETFVVHEDGKLILDERASAFSWVSDGDTVIDNYGEIKTEGSPLGGTAQGSLTFNNHAGGYIFGEWGPSGKLAPTSTLTINNEGTLFAEDRVIDFHDVTKDYGFAVVNNLAGGIITQSVTGGSTDLIRPGNNGTINNWGSILMRDDLEDGGDAIDFQDDDNGVVNNYAGVIVGSRHAVTGDNSITVFNGVGGVMRGLNGSAVNMDTTLEDAPVVVVNYGEMYGDSREIKDSDGDAIDVDALLELDNYGLVMGTGHEGYHKGEPNLSEAVAIGGGTINNYEGGTLYGYGRAIQVDDSENGGALSATAIYNGGMIEGGGNDPEGVDEEDVAPYSVIGSEAINLVGDWEDSLTNTGTIIGGVKMGSGDDILSNEGSMSALRAGALDMGAGDDLLDNRGTIAGDVDLGDGDDLLLLGGDIDGDVDLGDGDDIALVYAGATVSGTIAMGSGNDSFSSDTASALTVDGGDGNDSLSSGAGDDELIGGAGNDLLIGGEGDDMLKGGSGADVYSYVTGDGSDRIIEEADVDNEADTLVLADIASDEVTLYKHGDDLQVALADGNLLTVEGQFADSGIEQMFFGDGGGGGLMPLVSKMLSLIADRRPAT